MCARTSEEMYVGNGMSAPAVVTEKYSQKTVCKACKIHVLCCIFEGALEWFLGGRFAEAMGETNKHSWKDAKLSREMGTHRERQRGVREIAEERWECLL